MSITLNGLVTLGLAVLAMTASTEQCYPRNRWRLMVTIPTPPQPSPPGPALSPILDALEGYRIDLVGKAGSLHRSNARCPSTC